MIPRFSLRERLELRRADLLWALGELLRRARYGVELHAGPVHVVASVSAPIEWWRWCVRRAVAAKQRIVER